MPSCAPSRPTPWHRAGSGALSFALCRAWGGAFRVRLSSAFEPSAFDCLPPARLSPPAVSSLAASCQLVASQPTASPPPASPPVAHPSSSLQNGLMHRHSGGHRRDPFFAEIQYRGQKTSICESEKRDASGCLRKVLRLPRSVFSRSSCPKLTPHISTVFVHREEEVEKMAMQERRHISSWHTPGLGASGRAIHLAFEGDARAQLGYTSR